MAMERYHPELYDKIALASLMAPVAYFGNITSPIRYLTNIEWLFNLLGVGEILPSNGVMHWIAENVCGVDFEPRICSSVLYFTWGFDLPQTNISLMETIASHFPAGTSSHTIIQYAQEITSGKFSAYDFGEKENVEHYGQTQPPEYHPQKVTAPIAIYWGDSDRLTHKKVSYSNKSSSFKMGSGRIIANFSK